jgi:hypothetical protein
MLFRGGRSLVAEMEAIDVSVFLITSGIMQLVLDL